MSKLTPVNKTLFQDSATKKRTRTIKAKLPPSALSTGNSSPDIIVIADEDSKQVPELTPAADDSVMTSVVTEPSPVDVDSPSAAVSCPVEDAVGVAVKQAASDPPNSEELPKSEEPVEVEKKKRARKPRARKPTGPAAKKTQCGSGGVKEGEVDHFVSGAVTVEETPACETRGGEDGDVSKEQGGEREESGPRKRRRTAKALVLLVQAQSDAIDEPPAVPPPLPADVRLRLELLERHRGVALEDASEVQR